MAAHAVFHEHRFIDDIRATCHALGAPFAEGPTRRCVEVFGDNFREGAVVWKTTSRPADALCYRFFARTPSDTLTLAREGGLLPESVTAQLAWNLSRLPGLPVIQSCDFDASAGLAKTWLYLGGMRPTEEVLSPRHVPGVLSSLVRDFLAAGLAYVRFVAVDHRHSTANLYFRARGPLDHAACARILALLGCTAPPPQTVATLKDLSPHDFCVAVTVSLHSGRLERACFYVVGVPTDRAAGHDARIDAFFAAAPCHDKTPTQVLGWSFGPDQGTYLKAEKGYLGDMAAVLSGWDCYFSGATGRDPILGATV